MCARQAYSMWLKSPALTDDERRQLRLIDGDDGEITSRFYANLEFGTAGLRGVMGLGRNRMNRHVIRHTTQAFAQVITEAGTAARGVAVCYDCRHFSREFAREASCVLAANGIPVRIFESMRPTPELSFAIREYGLAAGINITASHNPREYNGYKVYWSDGAQLPPDQAAAVAEMMGRLDVFDSVSTMDYDAAAARGLITELGRETDARFLENVLAQAEDPGAVARMADTFRIVYTPFHGTGYRLVPEALGRLGVKNLYCVPEQMEPDGDFSTVSSPNPEEPESFALAVALAGEKDADLIIGTDPDADRVGILVRDRAGGYTHLSGNKTGALLLDYLIGTKKRAGTLPEKPVALKTIVTTDLARRICEENGVRCEDTFTGFKFMAERQNAIEAGGEEQVIFSYEESYGYMIGGFVRDKDAVTASVLLAEMTAWYLGRGMTLLDALEALYGRFGCYEEKTLSFMMPGLEGLEEMKRLMARLRSDPPRAVAGTPVETLLDYEAGVAVALASGERRLMVLSGSNVLRFEMEDGTSILVRPSGTEPKVKVYILSRGCDREDCAEKIGRYARWAADLGKEGAAP